MQTTRPCPGNLPQLSGRRAFIGVVRKRNRGEIGFPFLSSSFTSIHPSARAFFFVPHGPLFGRVTWSWLRNEPFLLFLSCFFLLHSCFSSYFKSRDYVYFLPFFMLLSRKENKSLFLTPTEHPHHAGHLTHTHPYMLEHVFCLSKHSSIDREGRKETREESIFKALRKVFWSSFLYIYFLFRSYIFLSFCNGIWNWNWEWNWEEETAKQTPLHSAHMDSPQDLKQSNKIGSKMALLSFLWDVSHFTKLNPLFSPFLVKGSIFMPRSWLFASSSSRRTFLVLWFIKHARALYYFILPRILSFWGFLVSHRVKCKIVS